MSTCNTQSHIEHGAGGTSFVGPDAVSCFAAFALASGLRLYAKTGLRPNRAYTPSAMLAAASRITGKRYKRGQHELAAADVQRWAEEMRDALPHSERGGK
jgi:hypothetical protein